MLLLDEIPEGLWEVDFFKKRKKETEKKRVREKTLILPAAHDQLEKTDLGLSDMDSGHVDGSISGPDPGSNLKNKYKTCSKHNI